jgi:hypothetical protein
MTEARAPGGWCTCAGGGGGGGGRPLRAVRAVHVGQAHHTPPPPTCTRVMPVHRWAHACSSEQRLTLPLALQDDVCCEHLFVGVLYWWYPWVGGCDIMETRCVHGAGQHAAAVPKDGLRWQQAARVAMSRQPVVRSASQPRCHRSVPCGPLRPHVLLAAACGAACWWLLAVGGNLEDHAGSGQLLWAPGHAPVGAEAHGAWQRR